MNDSFCFYVIIKKSLLMIFFKTKLFLKTLTNSQT